MHTASSLLRRFALLTVLVAAPVATTGCIAATEDPAVEEGGESAYADPEETGTLEEGVSGGTVANAAANSCTTSSVKGLSQQIIDEVRCMNADAYVRVPKLDNVSFGSAVFRYMERPARDKLVAALKAHPGTSMTVNSMLRTVAQQFLLYRWYQTGRCGIGLAAKPGNSNHETGLAIDISQYSTWKSALQNRGFHWLGSSDTVHFDYAGSGAVSHKGLDVKAFQRLWNRNHPGDKIDTDGAWGPQTEARMKKAPAGGFSKGATCASARVLADDELDIVPESMDLDDSLDLDQDADLDQVADVDDGEEQLASVEEPMLSPEPLNLSLVEELELAHEEESCDGHAH